MTFPSMPDAGMTPDDTYEAQLRELCAGLSDEEIEHLGALAEAMHAENGGTAPEQPRSAFRMAFATLEAELAKRPDVRDPGGLAAYIGKKNLGAADFKARQLAGRKKHHAVKEGDKLKAHHPAWGDVDADVTRVHKNGHFIATIKTKSGKSVTGVALRPDQIISRRSRPSHHPTVTIRRPAPGRIRAVAREWATRDFEWESRSAGGDGRTLEGYAAVFGSPTRIADRSGDFDEVIRPGAFARSLERRKPVLQFDHGRDPRVGSVPIGAIQDISEDDHGLYVRARLFDNPVVEPVRQAIAAQAIRGMSFRFRVPDGGDTWTSRQGDVDLREIHDADTAELGPVVFPAYESTSVSVRSMLERLDPDEYDELVRALAAELRGVPDLSDFTVGTDAGCAVGGEPGTGPGIGRVVPAVRTSDARHAHAVARFLQGVNIRG